MLRKISKEEAMKLKKEAEERKAKA